MSDIPEVTTPAPKRGKKAKRKPRAVDPSRPVVARWTLKRWAAERHALGLRALAAAGPALLDDLRAAHADAGEVERAEAKVVAATYALDDANDAMTAARSRADRWIEADRRFDALVDAIVKADAQSEPKPS